MSFPSHVLWWLALAVVAALPIADGLALRTAWGDLAAMIAVPQAAAFGWFYGTFTAERGWWL